MEVFQRFHTAGQKLKPSKCHLARSSVTFLGHWVSSSGVEPDPANTVSDDQFINQTLKEGGHLGVCS